MNAPVKGKAVLFSEMTPPDGQENAFNAWYDGHHTPNHVQNVPGFLSAQRYKSPLGPHYLAIYELDSPAALETEEYRSRKFTPDAPTKAMLDSVTGFTRYIASEYTCRTRESYVGEPLDAEVIIALFFMAPPERWSELLEWYAVEQAPMLLESEDWAMIRLMEVVEYHPEPTSHIFLHYARDVSVLESDELKRARATEWSAKLAGEPWFVPLSVFYRRRGTRFLKNG